ncbi:hypothetical protein AAXB25_22840 [Paenibacillus lautus]|uniref:hypothetical protein n=1 Tax=Paenibacillus lautus TaxID=1401 RepID=UPI003D2E85D4
MYNGKERLTQEQRMELVHENIAEMGMTIGHLIAEGAIPKSDLDISTTDISQAIIVWAKEFEEKYEGPDFEYTKGYPEIGNPETYIEAIDNFTDIKLKEAGWITEEYIAHKGRFWNDTMDEQRQVELVTDLDSDDIDYIKEIQNNLCEAKYYVDQASDKHFLLRGKSGEHIGNQIVEIYQQLEQIESIVTETYPQVIEV